MLTRAFFSVVAALALASSARAQLINENLLTEMPPGYKVDFQAKQNNLQMTEMVPTAETVNNWTEMVTVQVFHGMKSTPDQFKQRMIQLWTGACPNSGAQPVFSGVENGYPTTTWVMQCPLNPTTSKPEITWFKAVQGNDSFYVVQKAFKF